MFKNLTMLITASTMAYGAVSTGHPYESREPAPVRTLGSNFDLGYETDEDPDLKAIEKTVPIKFYIIDDVRNVKTILDAIFILQKRQSHLLWRFEYDIPSGRARINGFLKSKK